MSDDLSARLAAHPRWRWLPGMRCATHDERADDDGHLCCVPAGGCVPDLSDAATAGCLLAMVLALDPGASIESLGREPVLYVDVGDDTDTPCAGPTLGHACAWALVALGRCA